MRLKLLRRRLSISAPRMIVRRHLPWPLRWAMVALMCGFSAALALWAFEFGSGLAGLDHGASAELKSLRIEVVQLRSEREKAVSIANTAESLLTAERTAQSGLAEQLKLLESQNAVMKGDLGFFERLLPAGPHDALQIRGLSADALSPGHVRFQLLLMQAGKAAPEFKGRYELTLAGTLDGKPWTYTPPGGPQTLQLRQYQRVEGVIEHAPEALVRTASVRILDLAGAIKANLTIKL